MLWPILAYCASSASIDAVTVAATSSSSARRVVHVDTLGDLLSHKHDLSRDALLRVYIVVIDTQTGLGGSAFKHVAAAFDGSPILALHHGNDQPPLPEMVHLVHGESHLRRTFAELP